MKVSSKFFTHRDILKTLSESKHKDNVDPYAVYSVEHALSCDEGDMFITKDKERFLFIKKEEKINKELTDRAKKKQELFLDNSISKLVCEINKSNASVLSSRKRVKEMIEGVGLIPCYSNIWKVLPFGIRICYKVKLRCPKAIKEAFGKRMEYLNSIQKNKLETPCHKILVQSELHIVGEILPSITINGDLGFEAENVEYLRGRRVRKRKGFTPIEINKF